LKPLSDFHRRGTSGRQTWCRACRRVYDRDYHARTRETRIAQKRKRHLELRAWYLDLKRAPCSDCKGVFAPEVMTWDHLPGSVKLDDVANLLQRSHSKRVILREIAKSELVCANCHAIRSLERRGA